MVFRKFKKLADRVQEEQEKLVEDARDLLPAGRGGNPPSLGGGNILGTGNRRLLDRVPLETISYESPKIDSIGTRFRKRADLGPLKPQVIPGEIAMDTTEAIREVVNNPMIRLDQDMIDIINDPGVMLDAGFNLTRSNFSDQFRFDKLEPKKKRKVSKYQKELGRQLKMLKKKHPRTRVTSLMKRAHRATRKALK